MTRRTGAPIVTANESTLGTDKHRNELSTMTLTRIQRTTRVLGVAIAIAALALVQPVSTPAVAAAGLTNCVTDLMEGTNPSAGNRGCWEDVWVDGVEYRMTFYGGSKPFNGSVPTEKMPSFYVIGPQNDTPQSLDSPFMHDHVVPSIPRQSGGDYMPVYAGMLVVCINAACVSNASGLATTVNGHGLTSVEAIEAAAADGLVLPVFAGVILGTLGSR